MRVKLIAVCAATLFALGLSLVGSTVAQAGLAPDSSGEIAAKPQPIWGEPTSKPKPKGDKPKPKGDKPKAKPNKPKPGEEKGFDPQPDPPGDPVAPTPGK